MKENRSRRIIKIAQLTKSNVDNGGEIWEIRWKVQENKSNNSYYQRWKRQQNPMFIPDFRGI